jgi:hypothetical protein
LQCYVTTKLGSIFFYYNPNIGYQVFEEFIKGVVLVGENQDWSLAAARQQGLNQLDSDESFSGACKIKIQFLLFKLRKN